MGDELRPCAISDNGSWRDRVPVALDIRRAYWGFGVSRSVNRWDERRMFLLCLSLPPIVVFSVTPLWGGRGFAHWAMPGWFFTFALMGAMARRVRLLGGALRRCAFLSSALLAALAAVAVLQSSTGWPLLTLTARSGLPDPTLDAV